MSNSLSAESMRGCLGLGGFAVAGIGLVVLVAMLLQAPEAGITGDPGTAGGLVCMVVTIAAGLAMAWYSYRGHDDQQEGSDDVETEILDVVRDRDGRVTAAALADGSSLTPDEAETILARLAEDDYAELEADDDGDDVYVFPGLADPEASFDESELLVKLANLREYGDSSEDEATDTDGDG